ncbi:nephrin-like isoform X2 [Mya arenaria]|uniref:nephrin-like isoform X2 n=1 Tax=Mya arenaria TaxID=6604 RepID=UPI0022E975E2|nr:nephrin-like isoform X2 [Mya arenaria]
MEILPIIVLYVLAMAVECSAIITMTTDKTYVPVGADVHISCTSDVKSITILIYHDSKYIASCSIFHCQRVDTDSSSTIPVRDNTNSSYDIVSFELRNFQVKDSGTYKCMDRSISNGQDFVTIRHGGAHFSAASSVVPITEVILTPNFNPVNLVDGVPFNFSCVTSESRPAASVSWFQGSGRIWGFRQSFTVNYITTSTLTYNPSRDDQGELIWCEGKNGETTVKSLTKPQANIQFGPSVPDCEYDGADAPSSITVREGWTFSLDCNSSGNPTPSLTWTHPGPGPSSPLTLSNIQKSHSGTFTVTSSNTLTPSGRSDIQKSNSTSFVVLVMYKAAITEFKVANSDDEEVILNEFVPVLIDCKVDSYPDADIVLQKEGQPIKEGRNTQSIQYVLISSQCEDEGTYSCTGSNFLNSVSDKRTLKVFVKCSPRVSHTSPTILNVTAGTSSSATLTFNFIAYPRPSASDVTWERHDLQTDHWTVLFNTSDIAITLSQNSLQTNISFIDVKEINFGQYRVNVSNELGSITDTFFLKPEGVPSVPHNLKSSDRVTESSVNLTWISGFDGGHPQTFVVQFRDISTVIWKKEDVETGHTNHTLFNLKPGTTYEVKVTARNSLGNSASSDTITLTTLSVIDHTETSPNTVGGAIGGAIGAIAAVVIVVVILRRKYFLHRNASILKNTYHPARQSALGTENTETTVAQTFEDVPMPTEIAVYDSFNHGDNRSYNLHVNMPLNESSSKSQMYHAENVKKENPIYKYTRVKNPEETVL